MTPTMLENRYKVLRVLGSGGFGETFLAEDTQMPSSRRCVIKQLKPVANNPQIYQLVQQRFQQEAAILEDLGDGNAQIPRLYAYFSENGQFYLVQEYIEGQTLTQKLQQQGPLGEGEVRDILLNILPVLDYVHGKRIVHRDIKPDNIILRYSDGKPILIDFGAVKITMQTVVSESSYNPSIVIGTPGFMPTEQSIGRPVFSSDIYSLGLTAIYLLTGRMPQHLPSDSNTGEILWRQFAPHVSPNFAQVLDRAIAKFPRDRYPNAREMLNALQAASHAVTAPPPNIDPTIYPQQQQQYGQYPQQQIPSPLPYPPQQIPSPLPQQQQAPYPQQQAPYPTERATNSPQIQQIPRQNGLNVWQQGLVMGGIVGAIVVGCLFLVRPFITATETSQPVAQQTTVSVSDSKDTTTDDDPAPQTKSRNSSSNNNTPTKPRRTNPSTNSGNNSNNSGNQSKPTLTPTPTTDPPSGDNSQNKPSDNNKPGTDVPAITQANARSLVNRWLEAKKVMFAPPYDSQPAKELTTGSQYQRAAGADGSINSLKKDGHYYKFGVQRIDSVDNFSVQGEQAFIQVKVTEERTLYDQNGNVIPKETDFKTRTVRYTLQSVDKTWKIASTEIVTN